MANFLLLYRDGVNTQDASWDKWDSEISNSLIDVGNPTKQAKLVTTKEVKALRGKKVTRFRRIKADDLEEAVEISRSAPLNSGADAEVYQLS